MHHFKDTTEVYEIVFQSGKNYVGKGGFGRMIDSGLEKVNNYNDEIVAMMWKPAANKEAAFIEEYFLQLSHNVLSAEDKAAQTYNKIWSPGRGYFKELIK